MKRIHSLFFCSLLMIGACNTTQTTETSVESTPPITNETDSENGDGVDMPNVYDVNETADDPKGIKTTESAQSVALNTPFSVELPAMREIIDGNPSHYGGVPVWQLKGKEKPAFAEFRGMNPKDIAPDPKISQQGAAVNGGVLMTFLFKATEAGKHTLVFEKKEPRQQDGSQAIVEEHHVTLTVE